MGGLPVDFPWRSHRLQHKAHALKPRLHCSGAGLENAQYLTRHVIWSVSYSSTTPFLYAWSMDGPVRTKASGGRTRDYCACTIALNANTHTVLRLGEEHANAAIAVRIGSTMRMRSVETV